MSFLNFFQRAPKSKTMHRKGQKPRRSARIYLNVEAMEERAVPAIVKTGTKHAL
jgi:hypothetical protein